MEERWLPIPGYEGRYDVSDQGQVRSWLKCRRGPVPRILKPVKGKRGYLSVALVEPGVPQRPRTVHYYVTLAFFGPRPDGMEVRHLDGDKTHNAVTNLAYGTPAENAQDTLRHGTQAQAAKTHCKHGHLYDEENTRVDVGLNGRRRRACRACDRARDRSDRRRAA